MKLLRIYPAFHEDTSIAVTPITIILLSLAPLYKTLFIDEMSVSSVNDYMTDYVNTQREKSQHCTLTL